MPAECRQPAVGAPASRSAMGSTACGAAGRSPGATGRGSASEPVGDGEHRLRCGGAQPRSNRPRAEWRLMSSLLPYVPIETVVFDLGNVLFAFDHRRGCRSLAALAGVEPERVWQMLFDDGRQHQMETGQLSPEEFHALMEGAAGRALDVRTVAQAHGEIFDPMDDVIDVVAGVKDAGSRVVALSSTCRNHIDSVSRHPVWELFDATVLSHEVGCLKPDDGMYEAAEAVLGCRVQAAFFVDDLAANVEAARRRGWQGHVFRDAPRLAADLNSKGVIW